MKINESNAELVVLGYLPNIPPPNVLTPQEREVKAGGAMERTVAVCLGTTR